MNTNENASPFADLPQRTAAMESDPYLLGYRQAEQERLARQALELAPESNWLFDQIGIRQDSRVVEIGCGPRGCLDLLSERVDVNGKVIGIERSAEFMCILWFTSILRVIGDACYCSSS